MTSSTKNFAFETAIDELNTLVEKLEQGNLSLEGSLNAFEKGVSLTKQCQTALQEAEQKVALLVEKNGVSNLEPFEPEDS